jgi:hypothetical protein
MYVCFIPNGIYEESSATQPDPTTSATYYAYDYSFTPGNKSRSCWYIWKPDVLLGYPIEFEDNLFCSFTSTYYMKRLNNIKDYSDATTAIAWQVATAWFNKGAPTIDKEWIKLIVNSYIGGYTLALTYLLNYRGDESDFTSKKLGDYSFTFPADFKQVKQHIRLLQAKGQALSLVFENSTIFEVPRINGWEIEYSGDFDVTEVRP